MFRSFCEQKKEKLWIFVCYERSVLVSIEFVMMGHDCGEGLWGGVEIWYGFCLEFGIKVL